MCCPKLGRKLGTKHQATGLLKASDPGDTPHKGIQKYEKHRQSRCFFHLIGR